MNAKLSTSDCVRLLVSADPSTLEAEWKRRGKRREGDAVVRFFENVRTGAKFIVTEKDGRLSISRWQDDGALKPGKGWLFVIEDSDDVDVGFLVAITSRAYWNSYRCQEESSPQSVTDALKTLGLCECMECTYEPDGKLSKAEIKRRMEAMGFENDKAFQVFIGGLL